MRVNFLEEKLPREHHIKSRHKTQWRFFIKNHYIFCEIYSILAHLHPPRSNPRRVSNYRKNPHGMKTDGFDLVDGMKLMVLKI